MWVAATCPPPHVAVDHHTEAGTEYRWLWAPGPSSRGTTPLERVTLHKPGHPEHSSVRLWWPIDGSYWKGDLDMVGLYSTSRSPHKETKWRCHRHRNIVPEPPTVGSQQNTAGSAPKNSSQSVKQHPKKQPPARQTAAQTTPQTRPSARETAGSPKMASTQMTPQSTHHKGFMGSI